VPDPVARPSAEALLTRVPLFVGLGRVELARLAAHLEPLDLAPDRDVVRQGDAGDSLYVVERGVFAVLMSTPNSPAARVATLGPGDVFGEMALLTDEPRSATVRAETGGRVLCLARDRFLALLRSEPDAFLALATTLSRRLIAGNVAQLETEQYLGTAIERAVDDLPPDRRAAVLDACVLDELSDDALRALFGAGAEQVKADLDTIGIRSDGPSRAGLRSLRQRRQRAEARSAFEARVARVTERLIAARGWHHVFAIAARESGPARLAALLGQALRAVPALEPAAARRWAEQLTDDDVLRDGDLALARAGALAARGDDAAAVTLLRRALGVALVAGDEPAARRLSDGLARASQPRAEAAGAGAAGDRRILGTARGWRTVGSVAGTAALAIVAGLPGMSPTDSFIALLAAAIVLMTGRVVPNFAAGLALVAGWIVLGLAKPAEALAGFASNEWLFVLTIYGLAAATARSGVLFRIGLMLVRRLPQRLVWQAAVLLVTGVALTPLVPSSTGRASLTLPLTLAVAEALRLPERSRATAMLGLGAWIGSGPVMFAFLNGSGTGLLAWGLLPDASRARLTWTTWLGAAAPLTVFLCVGALVLLAVMFRTDQVARATRERVDLQFAVLGRPSRAEVGIIVVLCSTVAGWIVAPLIGLDLVTVALLGLLAAVAVGSFDARAFQALDWDFVVFIGVVLSIGKLAVSLGVDRVVANGIGGLFATWKPGAVVFVLAVAVISIVIRLAVDQDLTVLLGCLTLIPVAGSVGVDPWLVVIALLATSVAWFLPSQTPSYLVAQAASEGRLFTHASANRFAVAWTLLTLLGLALCVPYWRLLGLA
jgi:di/tricarboxylate transporter